MTSDSTFGGGREQAGSQVAVAWIPERKLQRKKESPLPLLFVPLVESLMGTLRFPEKRRQKVRAKEKEGHGHAPSRADEGFLV